MPVIADTSSVQGAGAEEDDLLFIAEGYAPLPINEHEQEYKARYAEADASCQEHEADASCQEHEAQQVHDEAESPAAADVADTADAAKSEEDGGADTAGAAEGLGGAHAAVDTAAGANESTQTEDPGQTGEIFQADVPAAADEANEAPAPIEVDIDDPKHPNYVDLDSCFALLVNHTGVHLLKCGHIVKVSDPKKDQGCGANCEGFETLHEALKGPGHYGCYECRKRLCFFRLDLAPSMIKTYPSWVYGLPGKEYEDKERREHRPRLRNGPPTAKEAKAADIAAAIAEFNTIAPAKKATVNIVKVSELNAIAGATKTPSTATRRRPRSMQLASPVEPIRMVSGARVSKTASPAVPKTSAPARKPKKTESPLRKALFGSKRGKK
ncbi:hypothetical protein ANO11243_083050 [Dothideomycetidae sp. 11243]|nr:hypothetical protein ANO11243_083050 [fungal sp. No.11243]